MEYFNVKTPYKINNGMSTEKFNIAFDGISGSYSPLKPI